MAHLRRAFFHPGPHMGQQGSGFGVGQLPDPKDGRLQRLRVGLGRLIEAQVGSQGWAKRWAPNKPPATAPGPAIEQKERSRRRPPRRSSPGSLPARPDSEKISSRSKRIRKKLLPLPPVTAAPAAAAAPDRSNL